MSLKRRESLLIGRSGLPGGGDGGWGGQGVARPRGLLTEGVGVLRGSVQGRAGQGHSSGGGQVKAHTLVHPFVCKAPFTLKCWCLSRVFAMQVDQTDDR